MFTLEGSRWALEKAAVIDGKLAMESLGVVYAFEEWQLEDGTICSPGGARRAPPMTPEEVRSAVDASPSPPNPSPNQVRAAVNPSPNPSPSPSPHPHPTLTLTLTLTPPLPLPLTRL